MSGAMAERRPQVSGLRALFVRDGRLRAGWRLLAYVILIFACSFVIGLPAMSLAAFVLPEGFFAPLLLNLLAYPAIWLATWLAQRFLDKKRFVDLGFERPPGWWPELLVGVAFGGLLMLGIFVLEMSLGWVRITGVAWQNGPLNAIRALALGSAVFVAVAFTEELLARGYLLQTVADGLNLAWGVLISSVIFGLLHATNPNATAISTFNLVIAGLFLAVGYVVTRRLWLPIGLHFGWNFFQGTVFGFPVSGTNFVTLVQQTETGPDMMTGGAFGPEAGLTGLAGDAPGHRAARRVGALGQAQALRRVISRLSRLARHP
jgi:membrane protease YdiL (CAAX protease family)